MTAPIWGLLALQWEGSWRWSARLEPAGVLPMVAQRPCYDPGLPRDHTLGLVRGEAVGLPEGLAGIWGFCFAWQGYGDMGYPFFNKCVPRVWEVPAPCLDGGVHGLAGRDHCLHSPGVKGAELLVQERSLQCRGGGAPTLRWSDPTHSSPSMAPRSSWVVSRPQAGAGCFFSYKVKEVL